jgi:hypothetical protein
MAGQQQLVVESVAVSLGDHLHLELEGLGEAGLALKVLLLLGLLLFAEREGQQLGQGVEGHLEPEDRAEGLEQFGLPAGGGLVLGQPLPGQHDKGWIQIILDPTARSSLPVSTATPSGWWWPSSSLASFCAAVKISLSDPVATKGLTA